MKSLNKYKSKLVPSSTTHSPRILTIACGYGEDIPIYRSILGKKCHIKAVDYTPRFQNIAAVEQNNNTLFYKKDARNLEFPAEFDLITMRHPEPSSNKKLWQEIFVEASMLARRSNAVLLMTTFSEHERDFFIGISNLMGEQGAKLMTTFTNDSIEPGEDSNGDPFGRDRYVAIFFTNQAAPAEK